MFFRRPIPRRSSALGHSAFRRMSPPLNQAQADAVNTLSGPLLVLAGAGTGKTRVITFRIAQLIKSGIVPSRILAVTFTNKAAREMRERALKLLGGAKRGTKPPEISTFHSLCVRILRRHAPLLGYPKEFAIYDRGDQETLARTRCVTCASATKNCARRPLEPHRHLKNRGSPDQAESSAEKDKEQLAAMAYVRYQRDEGLRGDGLRRPVVEDRRAVREAPGSALRGGFALRPRARGRIPGHERSSVSHPACVRRPPSQPLRRG